MAETNNGGSSGGGAKALKRYGPILLVVVIIGAVIAIASGGGDDDDDETTTAPSGDNSDLPITYEEAVAEGTEGDIEWGEGCDTELGRVKVPISNAAPCVEPWDETEDNGGATAQGVTADEILVVLYKGQPDPLQQALVEDAGANTDPDANNQVQLDYINLFADVYETYGRTVRVEVVEASGGPDDATAAQADALRAIELKPFAVVGTPTTDAWAQEIANAGIVCVGCGSTESDDKVAENAPYWWPTGMNPQQADAHLVEMVGKQLVGKPAEFAGDEAMRTEERVFGWIQAETETDEYKARNDAFEEELASEYDGEIATRFTYLFDPSQAADIATTAIARMKEAGVTSIILSTDPLIPANITKEATAQNYFPEWIIGPSVLADTTIFGRTFDQEQWSHALGLGLTAARAERELGDSYLVYDWYYGEPPVVNTQAVLAPSPARLALGIHLAGPDLTPENFERGMFRSPRYDSGLTNTRDSWGEDVWPDTDRNSSDDATTIWWDPEATGKDEAGNEGIGQIVYVDGGKRFLPGEWPTDPIPWFDPEGAVAIYDERPDAPPEYEPWPGSPAAG
ncbi:MAG: hypothetical protein ABWZ52_08995 [Acidimicrobiales bacterium]